MYDVHSLSRSVTSSLREVICPDCQLRLLDAAPKIPRDSARTTTTAGIGEIRIRGGLVAVDDLPIQVGNTQFSSALFQIPEVLERGVTLGLQVLDITAGDHPEQLFGTVDDRWSSGTLHADFIVGRAPVENYPSKGLLGGGVAACVPWFISLRSGNFPSPYGVSQGGEFEWGLAAIC